MCSPIYPDPRRVREQYQRMQANPRREWRAIALRVASLLLFAAAFVAGVVVNVVQAL